MKSYYSKIFKKSKIRRKATLSALDLGEKFSLSTLNNSRIISKLSEYSNWKSRGDDHDLNSLEDAIAKDFIHLANQNNLMNQKLGEFQDLHAQDLERVADLEEQVRIFSREKANLIEEYKILDSNFKFLSLKNEQLSNFIGNLQEQLRVVSNGQIDIREFKKASELEFMCLKLQEKLEELHQENQLLKSLENPSSKILSLPKKSTLSQDQEFTVPKADGNRYIPKSDLLQLPMEENITFSKYQNQSLNAENMIGISKLDASAQTEPGVEREKLEQAYLRLKKKNKELVRYLQIHQGKIKKDLVNSSETAETASQICDLTSEISVLGLKPSNPFRRNAEQMDKINEANNHNHNFMESLEREILNRDQMLSEIHFEYQELSKKYHDSNIKNEELSSTQCQLESNIEAIKIQLNECMLERDLLENSLKLSQKESEYDQSIKIVESLKKEINAYQEQQTLHSIEYGQLLEQKDHLQEEIEKNHQIMHGMRQEYQVLSKSYDVSSIKNSAMAEELSNLGIQIGAANDQIMQLSKEKKNLEIKLEEITQFHQETQPSIKLESLEELKNLYDDSKNTLVTLRRQIETYKEKLGRADIEIAKLLEKPQSLEQDLKISDVHLSKVREEYNQLSMENNKMNLKIFDLSEELYKLKSEIESEKEKNKSLSAQKAEIESCLNLLQKEKSLLKQELALNPHQELTKLQNECEESKNTILALRNEIKSYQEDLEMQQTEKNNLLAIKESLLRDMENLDLKLSLSNDEYQKVIENLHKAEIDSSKINAKLSNLKDQMKIMEKDFERERYESKDQYLKLQKDHEEALKFSSEQDLRTKETFAAFISVNNQLKSEQAQRVEIEQKLRKALDKNNALIDLNLKDELVNIQNKLNISEERLLSMGNKCAELEKESERKESEYLEELEEADSNFEELLEKYEKLSQKAILLETLYSKTQSDFSNRRQAIL